MMVDLLYGDIIDPFFPVVQEEEDSDKLQDSSDDQQLRQDDDVTQVREREGGREEVRH